MPARLAQQPTGLVARSSDRERHSITIVYDSNIPGAQLRSSQSDTAYIGDEEYQPTTRSTTIRYSWVPENIPELACG
ncbi:hypothetical protein PG997_013620 [Apiospora hydei]|uniref:Uncharacterized protein n=1 Tax=Apiospora hydei TaxID=1337664 RepID=A0ABR1VA90_9PEZI